jgi:methylated-DNA-[protein]-cysteine S-methyltransferase
MNCFTRTIESPVGVLRLLASEHALRAVLWEREVRADGDLLRRLTDGGAPVEGPCATLAAAEAQLREYFEGGRRSFDLALDMRGTKFQRRVWTELIRIPFGTTATYAEIAGRIGQPKACRAVGAANGRNPISIVVPCHRVIGARGSLTGFGGGIPAKAFLLEHEARVVRKEPPPRDAFQPREAHAGTA